MSFKFPANPKDGDIVIRLVNGVQIKGTYVEETNTWEVGELPEEPGIPGPSGPRGLQGEKGDPGQNLNVSGIVPQVEDLPPANDHIFQFWIVDDTNTVYYTDGTLWYNLGSPIQGPAGADGADGADGSDGENGRDGKGWYDTQIIDQRPANYQISFLSNDGLTFTTDNIMGLQGEPGSLQVATATNLGAIKIGRGLAISPDGTATAGITNVDLETVPIEGGNQLAYAPIFNLIGPRVTDYGQLGKWEGGVISTETITMKMPDNANRAQVSLFASDSIRPHPDYPNIDNFWYAFRGYYFFNLALTNARYQGLNATTLGWQSTHNMAIGTNPGQIASRVDTNPSSKFDIIEFEAGSTISFTYGIQNIVSGNILFNSPPARLIVTPFRVSEVDEFSSPNPNVLRTEGESVYYGADRTPQEAIRALDDENPDLPPLPGVDEGAENLKYVIQTCTEQIQAELVFGPNERLVEIRDLLRGARDLPGTEEEITVVVYPLVEEASALMNYQFRFES